MKNSKIELYDTVKGISGYFKDKFGVVTEIDQENNSYMVEFKKSGNHLWMNKKDVVKI
jgi:transcription antitermination factor NusG